MEDLLFLEREKRLLARLGPKMGGMQPHYGAASSKPLLSQGDVAAGLSFVRRPARDGTFYPDVPKQRLVMFVWAGHNSQSDLEKVLAGIVLEASATIRWKPGPGEIARLAALALLEHVYPTPCRTCSATGEVYDRVSVKTGAGDAISRVEKVTCRVCGGSGRRAWGRKRRSAMMGVSEWEWRKTWSGRYHVMQTKIRWMEARALAQIRRAMRNS